MRRFLSALSIALIAAAMLSPSASATAADSPPKVEVIKLTLHSMPAPKPALKYNLLPTYLERRPGNAAVHYGKVTAEQTAFYGNGPLQGKIIALQAAPLESLKADTDVIRSALNMGGFSMLQRASRCDSCDWDHPAREGNAIAIVLPEIQDARAFSRVLAAKARIHIVRGQFDEAIECFKINFALAKHLAQSPMIVSALVGNVCYMLMAPQIEAMIGQPGAPNLYWALSTLPRPLVNYRWGIDGESWVMELTFPEFRGMETQTHSPQDWDRILDSVINRWAEIYRTEAGSKEKQPTLQSCRADVLDRISKGTPRAKRYLIAHGRKAADVEAMPTSQIVLLYTKAVYEEIRDEHFKDQLLNGSERLRVLALQTDLEERRSREIIPLASTLLVDCKIWTTSVLRGEQSIAVLRIFEAIRLYGASHQGKLPAKLSDITEVPIPNDPLTEKPFPYTVAGEVAVLEVKTPHLPLRRYEIRLLPPK